MRFLQLARFSACMQSALLLRRRHAGRSKPCVKVRHIECMCVAIRGCSLYSAFNQTAQPWQLAHALLREWLSH